MRVALGQIDMVWEDKKASVAKAEKMICDAALQNADIIIFPEMSFTGFSMNLLKTGEKRHASDTVKKMCELSEKYPSASSNAFVRMARYISLYKTLLVRLFLYILKYVFFAASNCSVFV